MTSSRRHHAGAFDRFQTLDLAFFKKDNMHHPPRANINDKDLLADINASHKPGESMLQAPAPAQRNASGRKTLTNSGSGVATLAYSQV
jgi:hypothetical protein